MDSPAQTRSILTATLKQSTGARAQRVARGLLGAASLGQAHSHSGEPVVAVTALPPALGGSHSLHIMLPAFRLAPL